MKKVLALSALAILATVSLSSCKKDYTCTLSTPGMSDTVVSYNQLTSDQASTAKSSCTAASGKWSGK